MNSGDAVAKRILALCEQNKITPNKLCTVAGITQSTINSIINTGSNNPTVSTVKKICDGLNITLAEFFDDAVFTDLDQEVK